MAGTTTGRNAGQRAPLISAINVTPLVDVVLVLLIIMMVTSTYIVAHTLKVELPKTSSSDGAGDDPAVLTVTASGGLRYNGKPIAPALVQRTLSDEVRRRGELELVISADAKVEHGNVVKYIDIAKVAGVTRFAINVERTAAVERP